MRLIRYVLNNDWIIPIIGTIGMIVGAGMFIKDMVARDTEARRWVWVCPAGHIALPATDGAAVCVPGVPPTRVPAQ